MAKCLKEKLVDTEFDLITSVPMTKEKTKKRGYNQSRQLAKKISKIINIRYEETLFKIQKNSEQHTLGAKDRKKNCVGVYQIIKSARVKNKKILLCDDVITTGNTLLECVTVLKESRAKEVFCITLAVCHLRSPSKIS